MGSVLHLWLKWITKRLFFRFLSCVWHCIITTQEYTVIRFLVMTNYFGDHSSQYFHGSKSKLLETKCCGRNSNIRVWGIHSIYMSWNKLKRQPFLGVRSNYTENVKSRMELRPPLFLSSVCLGSNGLDSHWIVYLSKLRLQNHLPSLLIYV